MEANRIALIGLSILLLTTTTIALAQNTSNPMLSGNTTNPVLSGNTVSQGPQIPVSPTLNTTILAPLLGRVCSTIGKEFVYWSALHWGGPGGDDGRRGRRCRHATDKCLRLIAVVLKPPPAHPRNRSTRAPARQASCPLTDQAAGNDAMSPQRQLTTEIGWGPPVEDGTLNVSSFQ
jgi:hypothetical protein